MTKIRIVIFVIAALIIVSAPAYCQDVSEKRTLKTISGEVASVNWVTSKLVIRYFIGRGHDEVTFTVQRGAKILRGNTAIGFSDLHIFEKVKVNYYSDDFSGLKAVEIVI